MIARYDGETRTPEIETVAVWDRITVGQRASNNKGSGYVCGHPSVSSGKTDSGLGAVSGHAAPSHVSLEREKTMKADEGGWS